MGHLHRPNVLKLTVMIAIAIIAVSCVMIWVGTNKIIDAEQHAMEMQTKRLTEQRMKHFKFERDTDVYVMSWVNDSSKSSIVSIIDEQEQGDVLLEVYVNLNEVDLDKPLSYIAPNLNMVYEYSVEHDMMAFCEKHKIDYEKTSVAELGSELFLELIDYLQHESGVTL